MLVLFRFRKSLWIKNSKRVLRIIKDGQDLCIRNSGKDLGLQNGGLCTWFTNYRTAISTKNEALKMKRKVD